MTNTVKPVRRETLELYRGRNLVIELHSTYLVIRQKGRRTRYTVTYSQCWTMGAKNAAEETRRERLEAAKQRKLAKKGGARS